MACSQVSAFAGRRWMWLVRLGGLAGQPAFVDEAAKGDQRADEEAQRAPAGDEAFAQGIHGDHQKDDEGHTMNRAQRRDKGRHAQDVFERDGDADQQNKGDGFGKGGDAQGFHGVGLSRCEM